MTEPPVLAELRVRDIRIRADGDKLQLDAPTGALTPELGQQLRQHKNEILEFLREPAEEAVTTPQPVTPAPAPPTAAPSPPPAPLEIPKAFLMQALEQSVDDAGWAHLGTFGSYLNKLQPEFDRGFTATRSFRIW